MEPLFAPHFTEFPKIFAEGNWREEILIIGPNLTGHAIDSTNKEIRNALRETVKTAVRDYDLATMSPWILACNQFVSCRPVAGQENDRSEIAEIFQEGGEEYEVDEQADVILLCFDTMDAWMEKEGKECLNRSERWRECCMALADYLDEITLETLCGKVSDVNKKDWETGMEALIRFVRNKLRHRGICPPGEYKPFSPAEHKAKADEAIRNLFEKDDPELWLALGELASDSVIGEIKLTPNAWNIARKAFASTATGARNFSSAGSSPDAIAAKKILKSFGTVHARIKYLEENCTTMMDNWRMCYGMLKLACREVISGHTIGYNIEKAFSIPQLKEKKDDVKAFIRKVEGAFKS